MLRQVPLTSETELLAFGATEAHIKGLLEKVADNPTGDPACMLELNRAIMHSMGSSDEIEEDQTVAVSQVIANCWCNRVGKAIVTQIVAAAGGELQSPLFDLLLTVTSLRFEYGQIERIDQQSKLLSTLV